MNENSLQNKMKNDEKQTREAHIYLEKTNTQISKRTLAINYEPINQPVNEIFTCFSTTHLHPKAC